MSRPKSQQSVLWLAPIALLAVAILFGSLELGESFRSQVWSMGARHYAEFEDKLEARQAGDWYVGLGPHGLLPEAPLPVLDPAAGQYDAPVRLHATQSDPGARVRCTTDGSIPTIRSLDLEAGLEITRTTTVRCRTFQRERQASPIATRTYVVGADHALPVLAIAAAPADLWSPYSGIYARYSERGRAWERDAHLEYLPRNGSQGFSISGRVRIHGHSSRVRPKKSFRFYFPPLDQRHFAPDNPLTWPSNSERRVVVLGAREFNVSRDELFQEIYRASGGIGPLNMPVYVYLNGEPWGLYYIREPINEDFLVRSLGPGEYDLLYIQPGPPEVLAGDGDHWRATRRFFEETNFADPQAVTRAAELINLDDFTNFWLYNIYAANYDWPHHNYYVFRSRSGDDTRWHWGSWDADAAFDYLGWGLHHDTLAWATRSELRHDLRFNNEKGLRDSPDQVGGAMFAAKLLANPVYRERFYERMLVLLETDLAAPRLQQALRRLQSLLEPDLEADWSRWAAAYPPGEVGREAYEEDLARVSSFFQKRPDILRAHIEKHRESLSGR